MNTVNPADFSSQGKSIGGKRYVVTPLGGFRALEGTALLATVFAPVLGEVLDTTRLDQDIAMLEKQNTFKEILTLVTGSLNQPDIMRLVSDMLNSVTCDGEAVHNLDAHFQGKVNQLFELVIFAMEVNFKGFFTESAMFQSLQQGIQKVKGALDKTEEE